MTTPMSLRARIRERRGSSALEVMLAIVVLSTSILGTAAAQASAWRVLAATRQDTGNWAVLHRQAEEIVAGGFAGAASGTRQVDGQTLTWVVQGTNPKVVTLVADRKLMNRSVSDTLQIVLKETQ